MPRGHFPAVWCQRPALLGLVFLVAVGCKACLGQGTRADYARAEALPRLMRGRVLKDSIQPHWFAGGKRLWYRNDLGEDRREFVVVDAEIGFKGPAFDHSRLAAQLTEKLGKEVSADRLPIEAIEFVESDSSIRFPAEGKFWKFELVTGSLDETARFSFRSPEVREQPSRRQRPASGRQGNESPDRKWLAVVKNHNLFIKGRQDDAEFPLTTDGTPEHYYEDGVYWSPDSRLLVALRSRPAEKHTVHLIESSPRGQVQPKLHSFDYLKPGDRIEQRKPALFDIASRKQIPIDDSLFPNPWSIDSIRWSRESQRFTFRYNQRGHQVLRIIAVANTGETAAIIDEQSATFIDYSGKQFIHYAEKAHEIVWMSERDGWNHLYLYDSRTGEVKNQITRGKWVVRDVDRIDEEARQIWFRAGGIYPEQDPYYVHFCRIDFDGRNLVVLTRGNGTHSVSYSPDRKFFVDTYSRVDLPGVTELRKSADGSLVCELERGDWSALLKTSWQVPERFKAKGRDGATDIYGVIWRPTNFDPGRRYPVIEMIYAGPQSSFVPKWFSSYYGTQALAELGFIVVQIDGMGTSHRSKAFHDVCWKNLGDAGLPDRIAWLRKAAEAYPCMDLTRVGIYGGSAGGQNALRAMLVHGDFYKAAVADCGCHDNRMDKIWWNEQWMGWPIGPHYAEQSNVTQAHRLKGKLMLVVGELDRNVDPASTMQVAGALIAADRDFDLLVIPGAGHGAGGSPYGVRRRNDFFVRHLLGVEPRAN